MRHFALALVTVAAFAGDFLAHYLKLSGDEQHGWAVASTVCLVIFLLLAVFDND